jgi:DNA polymerase
VDVETFSACDLKVAGVDVYAEHASTGLWWLGYCVGNFPVHLWRPGWHKEPTELLDMIANGGEFVAWNAYFDATIWNEVICKRYAPHWPRVQPEQVNCLMARANALQLPPSLKECALTIGLPVQKDMDGHRLMLQMCRPRKVNADGSILWWDDPEKVKRLGAYCMRDVEPERLLHKRLLPLSDTERRVWVTDYKVNKRGIQFDIANVAATGRIISAELATANSRMSAITGGIVPAVTNTQALVKFVQSRGVECTSVDKEHIEDMLDAGNLPADVEDALELRQVTGKSSVAKIPAISTAVNSDSRARGMYTYYGASGTGRWAGRRVQPQNLPRVEDLSQEQVAAVIDLLQHPYALDAIRIAYGDPLDVLSQCLRAMIVPAPGHELIGGDYSQIEARVLPWLAGESWLLDAFRDYDAGRGPDIYRLTYARAYGIDHSEVTPYQRQLGKPMRLSLGYGGGFGAFRGMAKGYRIKVVEHDPSGQFLDRAKVEGIKLAFRESNRHIEQFWYDLDEAAKKAITCKQGRVYSVPNGSISYRRVGSYLFCRLPSGRCLSYVKPRVQWWDKRWPDGSTSRMESIFYYGQDPKTSRFTDLEAYGGKLSAHVTQATARDILAPCLVRLEDAGYPVILHSHDEPVSEVEAGRADPEEFRGLMLEREPWMGDLPIACGKPWHSTRYVKG